MGQRTLRFIIQIFKEKGVSRFNRENTLGFDHHSSAPPITSHRGEYPEAD
jgi:hypothetical protein